MITPICQKCVYLTKESEKFRKCPKIPIIHRDMNCSNVNNMIKDHVSGESYRPFCEEVNRHGECLEYYPKGLKAPEIIFNEEDNLLMIQGSFPIVFTTDGSSLSSKITPVGEYNEEQKLYFFETSLEHSCVINAACIEDGVLSKEIATFFVEIPDTPEINFDKSTNTVSIFSFNKIRYTTDGSKVTEDSPLYEKPFIIEHNTMIKCRSYAKEDYSNEVSRYCISIEAPIITFDPETNKVTIEADDQILYSTDGSDIFEDSEIYDDSFTLNKNTLVKAACLVDGELSEQTELECKVANIPVISYDEKTHKVSIEAENPILYTLDGSTPRKSSLDYTGPFAITESVTVKAVSVGEVLSDIAELECVFVSPPKINFDADTNIVSILGNNKILFSTDGSKIYDDSDEYFEPFEIDKNTTVKAACILNGVLSSEVTLICKVPSIPNIIYTASTKTVSIKSENPVLFTTDGSDVKKKDQEYKSPFKITATTTVKARSVVDGRLSEQAELECVI